MCDMEDVYEVSPKTLIPETLLDTGLALRKPELDRRRYVMLSGRFTEDPACLVTIPPIHLRRRSGCNCSCESVVANARSSNIGLSFLSFCSCKIYMICYKEFVQGINKPWKERRKKYMMMVRDALKELGVHVCMVDAKPGQDFGEQTALCLHSAAAMVAFCTSTYGEKTGAGCRL